LYIIFTKSGENVAHKPLKRSLDFGGNPDHVTLALGYRVRRDPNDTPHGEDMMLPGVGVPPLRTGGCVCLIVTILRRLRPWRRYALYWVPF